MALTLALPLFGLEVEHFSALSAKLLCDQNLRNLPDSGRASPSARSDSSGVSSLTGSGESESILASPRSETPDEGLSKSPEKKEEKTSSKSPLRVVYEERDILNLGANIRKPFWQVREQDWFRYDDDNFMVSHPTCHKSHNQILNENRITKYCNDCGFREPSPYLF